MSKNDNHMLARPTYMRKMLALQHAEGVKIITGVRRCGKSTLLRMYREHLVQEERISPDQIISIDFENMAFDELRDSKRLHDYVQQCVEACWFDTMYLLIDEVQELNEWARTINSLRNAFQLEICVTGSNSRMFAGGDLTYLAGRYVEVKMYPLSFWEFRSFRQSISTFVPYSEEELFRDFLAQGSFPAVALSGNPEVVHALLAGLVDSVIVRDVLQKGHIADESLFRRVAQFVFENIGSEISANRIANTLRSAGNKVTVNTIDRYLDLMCDAFVLYRCQRYDIHGKERLRNNPKYYVVDPGLRNTFLGERPRDMGHILENLVFLELLRRGYEVTVGRVGDKEVDFVAVDHTERVYVQVCQTLADERVEQREFSALLAIKDAYPKYVMSLDDIDYSHNGVIHLNIREFLDGTKLRPNKSKLDVFPIEPDNPLSH